MPDPVLFVCAARLDGAERYFLWESGPDADRVVLDSAGFIPTYPSEDALRAAARSERRVLSSEQPAVFDLDALRAWCASDDAPPDCRALLDAWNLFGDLPRRSTPFREASGRADRAYEKLFRGCNLPAVTPAGARYDPVWSPSELAKLKELLRLGTAEFRGLLR